jgi:hypothetical protein
MREVNKTRRLPGRRVGQNTQGGARCANLPSAGVGIARTRRLAILICACVPGLSPYAQALDLRGAVVTTSIPLQGPEQKAVAMLVEEVEKRTGIHWPVHQTTSGGTGSEGTRVEVLLRKASPSEGYRVEVRGNVVRVSGNDARGVMFGVGRLLRELRMDRGAVSIPDSWSETSAPRYPLRGHQLGYRPKTNSFATLRSSAPMPSS